MLLLTASVGHDDSELEEPDEDAHELLVSGIVDWGRVVSECVAREGSRCKKF